jgi:carbonic anhydrase
MATRRIRTLAVALAVAGTTWATAAAAAVAPEWNHDPGDLTRGPLSWSEIDATFEACAAGRSQSPVDVGRTRSARLPQLRFHYPRVPLTVENTGHVIEVPVPEESAATLRVGGATYELLQFHLHAPSEHEVAGRTFAMEAHLVHRNPRTGRLAVVGVLLDERAMSRALVDRVVANAPSEAGEEHEVHARVTPANLLPRSAGQRGERRASSGDYVTYRGSLTTPPCTEGVRWFVLERPGTVSAASVERHHDVVSELPGYDGYGFNNRPVQPRNGRSVLWAR